ncbi:MAG: Hsp20/alpha crystallin family protein [Proteobacteria bacterium]|nr:Hsp20/alpha crystallin family protein [Pseudomonadota bacterium]MBU1585173.1 Hsp20/alpha crystallin family protein [Pseudomonadota bacterium]MBU2454486.1 Hsp20/alpha crystallin family protein [Pseudomonadota bacterium]MBU2629063.1 Hsp20/alpha crystallin family protein [Pseudomonadota bacterium]
MTKKKTKDETTGEFGFSGLLKGLGNLIETAAAFAEKSQEFKKAGEINFGNLDSIKGLKDIKGVYGINVRTLKDGRPFVQSFGNIKKTPDGPVVEEVREPIIDLFEEKGTTQIIAEMPGIDQEDIVVEAKDDIIIISASTNLRKYQKEVLLSKPVNQKNMEWSYKNGVLVITIKTD